MCKVIGIDISKASFDVSFLKEKGVYVYFKFSNDVKGFNKFFKYVDQSDHCVMEASGPYYLFLAYYLFEKGVAVSVVNPLQIKHFVRMRMTKAKTDKKDAQMIAQYGESEVPGAWQPDQDQVVHLQQINTAVEGLHKQATMLHNQLEAFSKVPAKDNEVIKTLRLLLRSIKLKIEKLVSRANDIAESHYSQTKDVLTSIPGIGPKTAIMLIAITDNFSKFQSSKKLSAYVGLSPRIYQSGTSVNGKGHITKMGNRHMRKLLYLCAWSAKRHNQQCKEMYQRLKEKGKPEKVIKIAIANKLLRQAFAIATTLNKYDENYQYKFGF